MRPLLVLDRWFSESREGFYPPSFKARSTQPRGNEDYTSEPRLESIDTHHELSSINEFELKSIDWYGKPGLVRWGENMEGTGSFAELSQTLWAFCKSRSYWPQEPSALNWRVGVECFYTPRRVAGAEWISSQAAGKYLDIRECTQLAPSCVWHNSHYIRNS